MITFLSSLLCACWGLSVPAGTLRICVYEPVLGSPDSTENCMPFLSGRSVHFSSQNETMSGVLPSCFGTASSARTGLQRLSAASVTRNVLISALLGFRASPRAPYVIRREPSPPAFGEHQNGYRPGSRLLQGV